MCSVLGPCCEFLAPSPVGVKAIGGSFLFV